MIFYRHHFCPDLNRLDLGHQVAECVVGFDLFVLDDEVVCWLVQIDCAVAWSLRRLDYLLALIQVVSQVLAAWY